LPDILADEHFLARGGVTEMTHPQVGNVKMLANPINLSRTPPAYHRHPPLLGEHNEQVLGEIGYAPDEINRFKKAGVI
jgi:crotonobetainyl-CoA:carnitine CoA-transferase CaiB-like acyl-CoA transferase